MYTGDEVDIYKVHLSLIGNFDLGLIFVVTQRPCHLKICAQKEGNRIIIFKQHCPIKRYRYQICV